METNEKHEDNKFSPSDFMRGRRPELYSDSTYTQKKILSQEILEYHLHTITSRKQEYEFERFCTLLAEKELCPNLLPQTGPTGGGDSKVDSETYPVADAISASWYEGLAREASKERWAFAFSAKEKWRGKVRSDIQKIASTKRGYTVVYFITNQFVSDKKRSDMEDELTSTNPFTVRILDRTWIVETVLKKGHEDIASEALGLSIDYKQTKHVGALDAERKNYLKEIDENIVQKTHTLTKYALAEEVLQSAKIARELEQPKSAIYGRFDRAIALADEVGYVPQQIRCNYEKAWTAFWWYEDYEMLNSMYDKVETLVFTTSYADEFEYLVNLLTVAFRPEIHIDPAKFEASKKKVLDQLEQLSTDKSRPNNALYAQSLAISLRLLESMGDKEKLQSVFEDIKFILKESETISGFPITILIRIIQEIGEFLPDLPIIDEIFDLSATILEKKSSEESSVELLLGRASYKLTHDKPYDALGKVEVALEKSSSRDSRRTQIRLLLIACRIYESIGLFWAARGSAILALDMLFCELSDSGHGTDLAQKAFRRLLWIELQLGRTLHVLNVHHLLLNFIGKFADPENDLLDEEYTFIDPVLGLLIMKTDLKDLESLSAMLPVLDEHGLYHSHEGLLYALGYEDEVLENLKEVLSSKDELHHFFKLWREQPAYRELPSEPVYFRQEQGQICSRVLGVRLIASFERHDSAINFSETLLASIEAMMARYLNESVWPYVTEYKIEIVVNDEQSTNPVYEFLDSQLDVDLRIKVPAEFNYGSVADRSSYRKSMFEMMVLILVRIAHFALGEDGIQELLEKTKSSGYMANILSDMLISSMCSTASNVNDWLPDNSDEPVKKLIRTSRWDSGYDSKDTESEIKPGKGDLPEEVLDNSKMKHSQREVLSYIKPQYWDKAKWMGTGFMWSDVASDPPLLMLLFENNESGNQIFKDWRNRIGAVDTDEELRISIIRGINKNKPHDYRVLISANLKKADSAKNKQILIMNRIHMMTPNNSFNLEQFIRRYQVAHSYYLATAQVIDFATNQIRPQLDLMIRKNEINVRWAWEIPMHDPDVMGISPDDDPIIPESESSPPVTEVLEFLRKQETRR